MVYGLTTAKNPQITELTGVTAEGEETVVEPTTIAASQWPENFTEMVSRYVMIEHVLITTSGTGPKGTINGVPVTLFPAGTTPMSDMKPGFAYTVVGIPAISNTTNQIRVTVHPEPMIGVTVPESGVATFASKHAIDLSSFTDANAYVVSAIEGSSALLNPVSGIIPAGTGFIVMGDAGTYPLAAAEGEAQENIANLLIGVTEPKVIEASETTAYYGIKDGVFKAILPGTVPAGKAILPVSDGQAVKTLILTLNGTPVTEISAENDVKDDAVYDLTGRRVEHAMKGIYIVRGKKVLK